MAGAVAGDLIAEIGRAIDELAAQAARLALPAPRPSSAGPAHGPHARAGQDHPPGAAGRPPEPCWPRPPMAAELAGADRIAIRIAELWERIAELDPEVAMRLPGYHRDGDRPPGTGGDPARTRPRHAGGGAPGPR